MASFTFIAFLKESPVKLFCLVCAIDVRKKAVLGKQTNKQTKNGERPFKNEAEVDSERAPSRLFYPPRPVISTSIFLLFKKKTKNVKTPKNILRVFEKKIRCKIIECLKKAVIKNKIFPSSATLPCGESQKN